MRIYPYGNMGDKVPTVMAVRGPDSETLQNIVSLAAGADHALFITETTNDDGEIVSNIYAGGNNHNGQLGQGDTIAHSFAIPVKGSKGRGQLSHVVKAAAGDGFTVVLLENNTVWTWGRGDLGQLGNDTFKSSYTPVQVLNGEFELEAGASSRAMTQAVDVAAGRDQGMAIAYQTKGTEYAPCGFVWGGNASGQLGNGSTDNSSTPVLIKDGNGDPILGVTGLAGGQNHIMVRQGGRVYAMGANSNGQLNGTVVGIGLKNQVLQGEAAEKITENGTDLLSGAMQVAAGADRSFVMTTDGRILAFGANTDGRLGLGSQGTGVSPQNTYIPRLVGPKAATTILTNFTGTGVTINPTQLNVGENRVSFHYSDTASVQVDLTKTIHNGFSMWQKPDEIAAFAIPAGYTIRSNDESIVTASITGGTATVRCAGLTYSKFQKTGTAVVSIMDDLGNIVTEFLVDVLSNDPTREGPKATTPMVATSRYGSIALKANGTVFTWGTMGGQTQVMPRQVVEAKTVTGVDTNNKMVEDTTTLVDIVYVAAGPDHYIAIKKDGSVWMWGDNSQGQLGMYNAKTQFVKKMVYGWGDNQQEKMESVYKWVYDYDVKTSVPLNITSYIKARAKMAENFNNSVSGSASSTGDRERYEEEHVTLLPNIVAAAAGERHTLLLAEDGSVWAFGGNEEGQLGAGDRAKHYSGPVQVLKGAGTGDEDGEYLRDVIAIAASGNTSYALRSDGTVWAWGSNISGQLGMSSSGGTMVPVRVEKSNVDTVGFYLNNIFQISAGNQYALAAGLRVLDPAVSTNLDAVAYGWGLNSDRQLGSTFTGSFTETPQLVLGTTGTDPLTGVRQVSADYNSGDNGGSSLALIQETTAGGIDDSAVVAWGSNAGGQLGINSAIAQVPQANQVLKGATISSVDDPSVYVRENLIVQSGNGFSVVVLEEGRSEERRVGKEC